jgi:hypothetical protein
MLVTPTAVVGPWVYLTVHTDKCCCKFQYGHAASLVSFRNFMGLNTVILPTKQLRPVHWSQKQFILRRVIALNIDQSVTM